MILADAFGGRGVLGGLLGEFQGLEGLSISACTTVRQFDPAWLKLPSLEGAHELLVPWALERGRFSGLSDLFDPQISQSLTSTFPL